jgi:GNAT superfamily N-acetyltransferase
VHPDYRNQGVGRAILKLIINYTLREKIKYVGLTYDKTSPWLKDFYELEGFELIDFAMWHKSPALN